MKKYLLLYSILPILLAACSGNAGKLGKYWQQANFEYSINTDPTSEISLHYTGCGGLIIEHKGKVIITDPYFSNIPFWTVAAKTIFCGKIAPDPADINYGLGRTTTDIGRASGVFLTHAHYDHLLDVPWMFDNRLDASAVKIYGGNTAGFILGQFGVGTANLENVQSEMATSDKVGKWYNVTTGIRAMPIKSHHAPHFADIKLYCGENTKKLKRCKKHPERSKLNNWKEGQSFSWLFEFSDDNKKFHLLVLTSASEEPLGLPPDSLLDELGIDLAVMGTASYQGAEGYPLYHIDKMKPKAIMFVHWEDFFKKYQKPPRTVRGTNIKKFPALVSKEYHGPFWMPSPGVTMKVKY